MDQAEIQDLFRRFAAPLASYAATSKERRELAEMLAKLLWMAMMLVRAWRKKPGRF